jgi:hypothetical protein
MRAKTIPYILVWDLTKEFCMDTELWKNKKGKSLLNFSFIYKSYNNDTSCPDNALS